MKKAKWWEHPQYKRYSALYERLENLKAEIAFERGLKKTTSELPVEIMRIGRGAIMTATDDLALRYQKVDRLQTSVAIHGGRQSGYTS